MRGSNRGAYRPAGLAAVGLAAMGLALPLAGCGSFADAGGGSGLGSLLAFNTPTAPPIPVATGAEPRFVDCPRVEVIEGASAVRVGGGEGGSVRYQYSMGDLARECTIVGNQISIKVGVQGRVLIGPAGSPGTFSVPVRMVVRTEKDQKSIVGKSYRASATIPAGDTQVDFTIVSEPMLVPYTREAADEDYTVLVGFEGGNMRSATTARRRR